MDSFMSWFWLMVWWFLFFMYLMVLFRILADLFRDPSVGGWAKAFWVIGLIVLPFLVALIYIIARGQGMAERQIEDMRQAKASTDAYIRDVSGGGGGSPAEHIAKAKELLDSGAIDETEYAALKAKALA